MLSPNVGNFLRVEASTGVPFADAAVSTLFVLFAVYFLGHLWAFASSIFIEKTADLLLGKTSSACILAHRRKNAQNSFDDIADWVKRRWKLAWAKRVRARTALRMFALLPIIPSLVSAYAIRWFGYYASRVSDEVYKKMGDRLREAGLAEPTLSGEWYKAAEHYVINNDPEAVPRMYNYLVISGVFRSLSMIFLFCGWMECIRLLGHFYALQIVADWQSFFYSLFYVGGFNILFAFSFTSYIKFARRYAEEMFFALALKK